MTKTTLGLVVAIVFIAVLVSAGPVLVALAESIMPLAIVITVAAVVLRLVWYVTERYR